MKNQLPSIPSNVWNANCKWTLAWEPVWLSAFSVWTLHYLAVQWTHSRLEQTSKNYQKNYQKKQDANLPSAHDVESHCWHEERKRRRCCQTAKYSRYQADSNPWPRNFWPDHGPLGFQGSYLLTYPNGYPWYWCWTLQDFVSAYKLHVQWKVAWFPLVFFKVCDNRHPPEQAWFYHNLDPLAGVASRVPWFKILRWVTSLLYMPLGGIWAEDPIPQPHCTDMSAICTSWDHQWTLGKHLSPEQSSAATVICKVLQKMPSAKSATASLVIKND
jgi:hypothetical protein